MAFMFKLYSSILFMIAQRNDTYFMKSVVYGTCLNNFHEIEMLHLARKT